MFDLQIYPPPRTFQIFAVKNGALRLFFVLFEQENALVLKF